MIVTELYKQQVQYIHSASVIIFFNNKKNKT